MKEIMLDLETLGARPGCVIAQIAAIEFDFDGGNGREFSTNINIEDAQAHGFRIEAGAVLFWMGQSDEARRGVFGPFDKFADLPLALEIALDRLSSWIGAVGEAPNVWCNGAGFDFPILKWAYERYKRKLPWHFRRERDLRTLAHFGGYMPDSNDPMHVALEDCRMQIMYARYGYDRLRGAEDEL